jgi:hypothetical protein
VSELRLASQPSRPLIEGWGVQPHRASPRRHAEVARRSAAGAKAGLACCAHELRRVRPAPTCGPAADVGNWDDLAVFTPCSRPPDIRCRAGGCAPSSAAHSSARCPFPNGHFALDPRVATDYVALSPQRGAEAYTLWQRNKPKLRIHFQSLTLWSHTLSSPGVTCWESPVWPV